MIQLRYPTCPLETPFFPDGDNSHQTVKITGGESPPPSSALCLCLQYGAGIAGAAAFRKALCFSHKNHIYGRGEAYTVILHDGLSLPLQCSPSLFPSLSFFLSSFLTKTSVAAVMCSSVCVCAWPHNAPAHTHVCWLGLTRFDMARQPSAAGI